MMTIPAKVVANRRPKLVRRLRMPLFWHRYVHLSFLLFLCDHQHHLVVRDVYDTLR
jgi:hypothetical protein